MERFNLAIEEGVLTDLKQRLANVRWPEDAPAPVWQQGVPLSEMKRLCDYWLHHYDWRRCEKILNDFGQYRTPIDGVDIHFLHVRSPEPDALPIILTHGWPGSVIEFCKVIPALTNPVAHGGRPEDAFHVIVPSLPGYGFSGKPPSTDWSITKVADVWVKLVRQLGYKRFAAQGGDWGAGATTGIAALNPPELVGIHTNMAVAYPAPDAMDDLTETEKQSLAAVTRQMNEGAGYAAIHRTKPQTLGYSLADSPVGQAAWIYEKFRDWSDCNGDPLNSFTMDELLDNIMLYWLPSNGASSARMYAAGYPDDWTKTDRRGVPRHDYPIGVSVYPKELYRPSRRWAEQKYSRIVHWNELERGGHFAAFEVPDLFVAEMRASFRTLR